MLNCSSVEFLSERIRALLDESSNKPMVVLVGGCSRTGKTVLVSKLVEIFISSGINTVSVQLDSWLISVENRREDSSVLERYEIPSIIASIKRLQQGEQIYPPVYDAVSRRRIKESGIAPISINEGILFIEGVVALAIGELVENAKLGIFVDIPDELRRQRLVNFYSDVKRLDRKEYEDIIKKREKEEVTFIKETAVHADVIFNGLELE
jgi:uridine kinase